MAVNRSVLHKVRSPTSFHSSAPPPHTHTTHLAIPDSEPINPTRPLGIVCHHSTLTTQRSRCPRDWRSTGSLPRSWRTSTSWGSTWTQTKTLSLCLKSLRVLWLTLSPFYARSWTNSLTHYKLSSCMYVYTAPCHYNTWELPVYCCTRATWRVLLSVPL